MKNTVRVNIILPEDLLITLKKIIPARSLSKFLTKAAREKIVKIEKEEALKELLEAPASFEKIKDSASYIRKLRRLDEKRAKRLSL